MIQNTILTQWVEMRSFNMCYAFLLAVRTLGPNIPEFLSQPSDMESAQTTAGENGGRA